MQQREQGIGCGGLITIILVILKMVGVEPVASWSWWWVTCLVWGPMLFGLIFLAFMAFIAWVSSRNG